MPTRHAASRRFLAHSVADRIPDQYGPPEPEPRRMKRSEINAAVRRASVCFKAHGWALPPNARWAVTDFGLGSFQNYGLVAVSLATEQEYSERIFFMEKQQRVPAHFHRRKKQDIICRYGRFTVQVWEHAPGEAENKASFVLKINGATRSVKEGESITLNAGERITIPPGICHEFHPASQECILAEISTQTDDQNDNFFIRKDVQCAQPIEEDEPAIVDLEQA